MLDTSESQVVSAVRHQVFIVDGHPIVRQGLKQLINKEPDLQVCGEAKERQEALEAVTSLNPDLAVVELVMREGSGLDLIKALQALMSELPILVVSIHDETLFAERALRAGARGYIMKQEATETLLSAIRRVLQGEIYVSERMTDRLLRTIVKGCFAPGDSSSDHGTFIWCGSHFLSQGLQWITPAKRLYCRLIHNDRIRNVIGKFLREKSSG